MVLYAMPPYAMRHAIKMYAMMKVLLRRPGKRKSCRKLSVLDSPSLDSDSID